MKICIDEILEAELLKEEAVAKASLVKDTGIKAAFDARIVERKAEMDEARKGTGGKKSYLRRHKR